MTNQKPIHQTLQEVIIILQPQISGFFLTTALFFDQYFWYSGEWRLSAWGEFGRGQDEFIRHQRAVAG
jgi:hypothetical protein